jgi:hypothetical protein
MPASKLVLEPGHWYAWLMVPGYAGERNVPYASPIYLRDAVPKHTGRRVLELSFSNVLYAEGVQDFSLALRLLKHSSDYLIGDILYDSTDAPDRAAIVSRIEFEWIRRFCPDLWMSRPPSSFGSLQRNSVAEYLDTVFGQEPPQ